MESPRLTRRLRSRGRHQSEERIMNVTRITQRTPETRLAVLHRSDNAICFMRPVALQLKHIEVQVRQIETEARGALDGDVRGAIIGYAEGAGDGVVSWEDGVRQRGSDGRVVVVKVDSQGRDITIIPIRSRKPGKTGLAIADLMRLIDKLRDGIAVRVRDVNCWEPEVASSYIREFTPLIPNPCHPAALRDRGWVDEVRCWAAEVVGDEVAGGLVDVEEVGGAGAG